MTGNQSDSALLLFLAHGLGVTTLPSSRTHVTPYSTVARLKLACSERSANYYNSDMHGLIEPGYGCIRILTRPYPDYRKSSFPTKETILRRFVTVIT